MPTLATSNRAQLRYVVESAFGVIPATPAPNNLRQTGESLAFAIQTSTSKELRSDRQITDLVQTGAGASGAVNFEMSYKEFDTLIAAALQSTWVVYGTLGLGAAVALGINSTAGTLTAASAPTGVDAFTNLAVGQWFKLTAPTDAADGAYLKVLSRTTTVITVDTATPIPGTGTRAAVAGCIISSSRLSNGVTQTSYTIERAIEDVNQFFAYRGMVPAKLSMSFASGAIATGSIDFTGKDSTLSGTGSTVTTSQLTGTPVASQTYDVMNAVSGVGSIMEGGAALTGTFIKSLKFDADNKLRGQTAIGTLGNAGIGSGTLEVKGDIEVYLADGTMYKKFINNTISSISWRVVDGSGNGYIFTFPKVRYSDAKVQAGGLDQDVMLSMPFTALMDPTTLKTILIDRVGV